MTEEELSIPLEHAAVDAVRAVLHHASGSGRRSAFLLAHGAGIDMDAPLLVAIGRGLAARGIPVMRFRFVYRERMALEGRQLPPDRTPDLEHAHQSALDELTRRLPRSRHVLAGKSLGGRIGTHLAAKGADVAGLVLLGYPLHPPGEPDKERSEHFAAIAQPALFLQGTRDEFGAIPELERALSRFGGRATLAAIEGADHGFDVLARSGRTREEVERELLERIDAWERATFPE